MCVTNMIDKVKKYLEGLSEECSAYLLFSVFILIALAMNIFNKEYAKSLFIISVCFLSYGFLVFLFSRLWNSPVGKILSSWLVFTVSTFSFSLANISINGTFQVPAAPFVHTQALLSALLAPLAASIVFGIASIVIIPALTICSLTKNETVSAKQLLFFWKKDSFSPENTCVIFIRIIVLCIFLSICLNFSSNNSWYVSKLMEFAKWYAYNFETERFSYCKLNKNERVAYIGDDNIVVATEENGVISFKMAKCVNVNEK